MSVLRAAGSACLFAAGFAGHHFYGWGGFALVILAVIGAALREGAE